MAEGQSTPHDALLARVEQERVRFVDLQFTDIAGLVKNVTIPAPQLGAALERGIWFDGSCLEGLARVAESDMYLLPDPATYAVLPWLSGEETTARLICNIVTPNGQPFLGDPRAALVRAVAAAEQMGLVFHTGPELEFFLLKPHPDGALLPPQPGDGVGYFDVPSDLAAGLRRQMTTALAAFGIVVEALHHEGAAGQHEIDFRYADALRTADHIVTLRMALKLIAQQHGLYATFVPKLLRGLSGSGMHVHQSLTYKATGGNALADPGDAHGLSKLAKHFIAGQLAHARGMCVVVAPLISSYKRLISGYEAPVNVQWARVNRSALIRVPRANTPEATRLGLRCPDPSCNPYLAFAAMLAAGLDGIRRELAAPEVADENLFQREAPRAKTTQVLPRSLEEALDEFAADAVVREALGPYLSERYANAKRLEWDDYCLEVTRWEQEKYLPLY